MVLSCYGHRYDHRCDHLLTVHVPTTGDMLLVRFMHLDSRDPDRECTLFVDLSQDDYKGEKLRCGSSSGER